MTVIIDFTNIIVVVNEFDNLSFKSKYSFLDKFLDDLDKFNKLNPQTESKKVKKNVYNKASELYNDFLGIYFDEYYELSDDKRKKRVQI